MALPERSLLVKRSQLPGAGMGLFTKQFIPRNTIITEYKGKLVTWKEAQQDKGSNGYLYYINRHKVIDARGYKKSKGRYANDAKGLKRVNGLTNNSAYIETDKGVFIKSTKDIAPGEEILVGYGKEYWDTIRYNIRIDARNKIDQ